MTDVAVLPPRRDPLTETLFRPTVARRDPSASPAPSALPVPPTADPAGQADADDSADDAAGEAAGDGSAAPRRAVGTRVRAGNAMARTRAALLDGAARSVALSGSAITMAQVAAAAGVAKATLYNHFRTREAVLTALARAEVESLADEVADLPLRQALVEVAAVVATHPALAALRAREPEVLARLLAAPERPPALAAAHDALVDLLAPAELPAPVADVAADVLLRWLVSLAQAPAAPADVLTSVDLLLTGLLA